MNKIVFAVIGDLGVSVGGCAGDVAIVRGVGCVDGFAAGRVDSPDEGAAASGLSWIGRVRRKARVKAAADAHAYLVQASARFSPTMSLMPRIASIGQRPRAARYTPPDSISIASRLRAS